MTFEIRQAISADAIKIAKLHTRVWHATYAGIAPQSALDKLNLKQRTNDWTATLGTVAPDSQTYVAIDRDNLVGFVHFHINKPLALGVVQNLYIAPDQKNRGIGRQLMRRAFANIADANCNTVELAVADGNDAALAFYQYLGGKVQQKPVVQGHFWRSKNWIVRWDEPKLEEKQ